MDEAEMFRWLESSQATVKYEVERVCIWDVSTPILYAIVETKYSWIKRRSLSEAVSIAMRSETEEKKRQFD